MQVRWASRGRASVVAVAASLVVSLPVSASPAVSASPGRIFIGDYSTGDFSQWTTVQLKGYNGPPSGYVPTYSAQVVDDAVKGKAATFEVRDGDTPPWGGGERSQVTADGSAADAYEGDTRWYALSTRFDPTFPQNHGWGPRDIGFGLTSQFHGLLDGSPPVAFFSEGANMVLKIQQQGAGAVHLHDFNIWETPMSTTWHEIKMQIHWSTDDSLGWIRLWHNGIPQTFLQGPAGTRADNNTTYYIRTLVPSNPPGGEGIFFAQGYYRAVEPTSPTGIVYHAGFTVAVDEAGL